MVINLAHFTLTRFPFIRASTFTFMLTIAATWTLACLCDLVLVGFLMDLQILFSFGHVPFVTNMK
jgi:hypothetical protein